MRKFLFTVFFCIVAQFDLFAQHLAQLEEVLKQPDKLLRSLQTQEANVNRKMIHQTNKYIARLKRQENKLKKRLWKTDTLLVKKMRLGSDSLYGAWKGCLTGQALPGIPMNATYSSKIDTMRTALKYLCDASNSDFPKDAQGRLLTKYNVMSSQITQVERLRTQVQTRRKMLKEKLSGLGVDRTLFKYQKQAHYYQQQLAACRKALEEPEEMEQRALEILCKIPSFRKYFDQFSQLSKMFRLPGQLDEVASSQVLNGLQTRQSVLEDINTRLGGKSGTQQAIRSGMQEGCEQLSNLKNRLNHALESGEPADIPGFKPNQQKVKTFLDRIEWGTNMQSARSNQYFPSTTDFGLSAGYKLNDKSIIGIGASYKIGWGENIRKISMTHEGMGIRSFLDFKIRGGLWLTGGGEWNYRSRFSDFTILKTFNHWEQSALLGLQRKQKVGKYKATASLVYDFLWQEQVPNTQPVLFRVGYSF